MLNQCECNDPWIQLQQPMRPVNLPPAYMLLLAALDQGWHVIEPVIINTLYWGSTPCDFAFTLQNISHIQEQQVKIPTCLEVETFIREEMFTCLCEGQIVLLQ